MQIFQVTAKLWVKRNRFDQFEAFETAAFEIMERHGGKVLNIEKNHSPSRDQPHEVHTLAFPTQAAFEAYRTDPDLRAMSKEREACIEKTEIAFG